MGNDTKIDTWLVDNWLSYEVSQKRSMTSHQVKVIITESMLKN